MTKVTFFTHKGTFYGFKETGHAMYADYGNDVLCAALSSMTMLVINAIEVAYGRRADYTVDEDNAAITLVALSALPEYESDSSVNFAVSGLISAYFRQLEELVEEYYDYLDVAIEDRDPEEFSVQH